LKRLLKVEIRSRIIAAAMPVASSKIPVKPANTKLTAKKVPVAAN
jgi:hypothetical protein